ncbi:alpha/beta hydrolase [Amycolatopsis sp. AA4]|uniref:alpha/beta fold hydrolase n=1 Tax=Actinomycetes TaxID=1760 RepID=UPI0001B5509F|nr:MULTISPECIES: alpha/beta fold hydrolase [Actinomycetes]ATY13063.1 alpha/beta hydrolase [Amycolatopsis sp. AA4]EFL08944.1 2-hydroxy-6-oxo-6-phenylhexa-2,4-dienoate hydrolase [Streptomyces sp. AA4]
MTPELLELPTEHGVLRYRESGDGPPLVLLHGSGPGVTGWRNFGANLPAFARHYRTIVLEFPGFGVSDDFGAVHPMQSAGTAVRALLDGLSLDRVRVVGNSMGGFVATDFALSAPERVERLVTIGGIGTPIFSAQPGEGIVRLSEFVENPTRAALVAWLRSMVYDQALVTEEMIEERWSQATDPATLENSRRMYGAAALAGMAAAARGAETPAWAQLRRLDLPTLVTWGRDDRVSPVDMALLPMRALPRGEVHIFPNCGHWVMIEQKDAWEAAVLAFLGR